MSAALAAEPSQEVLGAAIQELAGQAHFDLSASQAQGLGQYLLALNRWNRVHSLTAIEGYEAQISKHLLDSLVAAAEVKNRLQGVRAADVADVGSGMGAPGLIWALVMPESRFELIERQQKKSAFLRHVIGQLGLGDRVSVVSADVRSLEGKKAFDLITSRAFAGLEDFLSLTVGISRQGTRWAAMLGRCKEEVSKHILLKMNQNTLEILIESATALQVPGLVGERHLLMARRVA